MNIISCFTYYIFIMENIKITRTYKDYFRNLLFFVIKLVLVVFAFCFSSYYVCWMVGDLIESSPKNQQVNIENDFLKSFWFPL